FLFAHNVQVSAFQQQRKKTLSEILHLFRPDALSPRETINWSPVCEAKFFECLLCRRPFTLRLQHHAPVRGSKRHRLLWSGACRTNRGQRSHTVRSGSHMVVELRIRRFWPISGALGNTQNYVRMLLTGAALFC